MRAHGNTTLENADDALTTYAWDGEDRLTQVAAPAETQDYAYFASGLRARKETPAGTTNFIWDGQDVLLEKDAALATTARYTGFPGYWGGLQSMRRNGASSFYGMDLQDTASALLSAAEAVTDAYVLTAFGEEVWSDGVTVNPFRFEGAYQYYRDVAERLYVRARYLDPIRSSWLSTDPLRFFDGKPSPYAYVINSPTSRLDPSGLLCQLPFGDPDCCDAEEKKARDYLTPRCPGQTGVVACNTLGFDNPRRLRSECLGILGLRCSAVKARIDEALEICSSACAANGQAPRGPGFRVYAITPCCPVIGGLSRACKMYCCRFYFQRVPPAIYQHPIYGTIGPCLKFCLQQHEQSHADECNGLAPYFPPEGWGNREAWTECNGYLAEAKCLRRLLDEVRNMALVCPGIDLVSIDARISDCEQKRRRD